MKTGIQWKRIVIGGLVAGVIFDVLEAILAPPVIGAQFMAEAKVIHLSLEPTLIGNIFFPSLGFVFGFASLWVYALARTRYGPGPWTALRVAFVLWVLFSLKPQIGLSAFGLFSLGLMLKAGAIQLVSSVAAVMAGAWLYRE